MEKLIFVVDDSKIIAQLLTKSINDMDGYKAEYFLNSKRLFEHLENKTPDLIFLDYFLDNEDSKAINGEIVLQQIKANWPKIKVIMLTGASNKALLDVLAKLDIVDLLHKDNDDVLDIVQEMIRKHA